MSKGYSATSQITGKVHTRTTKSRTYTHCVVIYLKGAEPTEAWPRGYKPSVHAEWAGSEQLARNNAARWQRSPHCETVEVLPAVEG